MSTKRDPNLPQSFRVHGSSAAADARKVRTLGDRIFKELLPWSTKERSSERQQLPLAPLLKTLPRTRERKDTLSMKAFRTESRYYFSSKQLLPVGSLVFFSERLQQYVHPTDGVLLEAHPLVESLSDAESLELEAHWQNDLSRYQ